jgi:hypothetical protein
MRFMLSSHPRIYIPEETGFLVNLAPLADRRLSRVESKNIVERIGRMNVEWLNIVDDFDAFFDSLAEPRLMHLLDGMYRIRTRPYNAERWGDKGPAYVAHIPALDRIFPDAQFIHMVRDGRDSTVSALQRWKESMRYLDTYYVLKNWARNVDAGIEAAKSLAKDRYLEVRYERLVSEPEATLKGICEFLGETFDPAMLNHPRFAQECKNVAGHYEVYEPTSTKSVSRWQRDMPPFDQKLALRIAGPVLAKLGYDTSGETRFSFGERLRYGWLALRFKALDSLRKILYATGYLNASWRKSLSRNAKKT